MAPAPIENALKGSPYILNVALVGDRRRFIGALIVINVPAVEARARADGISLGTGASMTESPWVHSLVESEIARLTGIWRSMRRLSDSRCWIEILRSMAGN